MARYLPLIFAMALLGVSGTVATAEQAQKAKPEPPAKAAPAPQAKATVPQPSGDGREAIELNPQERARMLEGMRLYLQALQGVVESLAKNQLDGVAQYAHEAGAKMLQDAPMSIPLKAPLPFTALSLQTHEKFDVLADRARAASRGEVLTALAEIMGNCTGCHSVYRVVPAP